MDRSMRPWLFAFFCSCVFLGAVGNRLSMAAEPNPAQIERNRERWNGLSPEEKERILQKYREWKSFSREKKDLIRKRHETFRSLPPERQAEIRKRIEKQGARIDISLKTPPAK